MLNHKKILFHICLESKHKNYAEGFQFE